MTDIVLGVGDVVTLKSGGPAMTIEGFEVPPAGATSAPKAFPADKLVRVVWFDASGIAQERTFWPHLLILKDGDKVDPAPSILGKAVTAGAGVGLAPAPFTTPVATSAEPPVPVA